MGLSCSSVNDWPNYTCSVWLTILANSHQWQDELSLNSNRIDVHTNGYYSYVYMKW